MIVVLLHVCYYIKLTFPLPFLCENLLSDNGQFDFGKRTVGVVGLSGCVSHFPKQTLCTREFDNHAYNRRILPPLDDTLQSIDQNDMAR